MVDTYLIAEKMHLLEPNTKISMKIYPYVSGKMGANRSEAAKIEIFFTECSVIPQNDDILRCNDIKTGDFERHLRLFNVRKLHRPHMWDAHRMLCLLCFRS